jgi:hypothetical protein
MFRVVAGERGRAEWCGLVCVLALILGFLTGTVRGQYTPAGIPKPPPPVVIQIPPPVINVPPPVNPWAGREKEMEQATKWWEQNQKNAAPYLVDVPNIPDPKKGARTFGYIVDATPVVAVFAAVFLALWLGIHVYVSWRPPVSAHQLALNDPWVRARLKEMEAQGLEVPAEAEPGHSG